MVSFLTTKLINTTMHLIFDFNLAASQFFNKHYCYQELQELTSYKNIGNKPFKFLLHTLMLATGSFANEQELTKGE